MQETQARRSLSLVLTLLMALSLLAVAPLAAGADEPGEVTFSEVPGDVRAGRTVPVQFTVTGAEGEVSATVVDPEGGTEELVLRERPRDGFQAQVRTDRATPGYYELVVSDDGGELGSLAFPAFRGSPGRGADVVLLHDTHFHGSFGHDEETGVSEMGPWVRYRAPD